MRNSSYNARKRTRHRILSHESLERRHLLASLWQNPVAPVDVTEDGIVSPIDALLIINHLNAEGSGVLPNRVPEPGESLIDTNGDRFVSPIDVLLVINHLNGDNESDGRAQPPYVLTEKLGVSEIYVPLEIAQAEGTRTLSLKIEAEFDESDATTSLEDLFSIRIIDRSTRQTVIDRGVPASALFTLSGDVADFQPGQVRFDGTVVEIDLTSDLLAGTSAFLQLQLVNLDSDFGTRITVTPLGNVVDATAAPPSRLADSPALAQPGDPLDLTQLGVNQHITLHYEQMVLDTVRDLFAAEVSLTNEGPAVGRDVVVVFSGMPADALISNASGTNGSGQAYLNFRPAISAGGLDRGARSRPIRVEWSTAERPLDLRTQVLVGASNRPPEFEPLVDVQVVPGREVSMPLVATDADGDPIYFISTIANSALSHTIDASGTLTLRPTPAQLGEYTLEFLASDGVEAVSQQLRVTVADDLQESTRVSGRVLDIDQTPLAGVLIEIGSVQVLTGADGSFTVDLGVGPLAADTIKVRGEKLAGADYPFIAEKLPFVLGHEIYRGFDNVIERPIYLPKLDVANGKNIDPMQDTLVTTEAIPGAAVMVKAGTLLNQQGTPFTGTLSITEVPPELTPAAIPDNLFPELVVTIQPGEMVFATPAPLTLPNRGNWPAGTIMDLWSINPVTGEFEKVGKGKVSDDGELVETIEGGIRNSSWHFFIWELLATEAWSLFADCSKDNLTACAASRVDLHSGNIIETVPIVTYFSQSQARNVSLVYNSLHAAPRTVVEFSSTMQCILFDGNEVASQKLQAELHVGFGDSFQSIDKGLWGLSSCSGGGVTAQRGGALIGDMRHFPTGQYQFKVKAGITTEGVETSGGTSSATILVPIINLIDSPYGSGWDILGVQRIVPHEDGSLLLVDGSGGRLRFKRPLEAGGPYQSPVGDFSRLERLTDFTYRRTLKDQTVYQFDLLNRLASMRDRNGNTTEYRYQNGRLSSIVDPVGLTTRFIYSGARLAAIMDPYGRSTSFAYDQLGNLTKITAPDGSTTSWAYNRDHLPIRVTDPNGHTAGDRYDSMGRATSVEFADGSTAKVRPSQTQGLARVAADGLPAAAVSERSATYVDANGNVIKARMDRLGQPMEISDSIGHIVSLERNTQNLISQELDGRGNRTDYFYDDRGNLITVTDAIIRGEVDADVVWIADGGEWNDPKNWSTGSVPGPDDFVFISDRGTAEITISGQPAAASRLISFEHLRLENQTLTLSGESRLTSVAFSGASKVVASGAAAEVTLAALEADHGRVQAVNGGTVRLPQQETFTGLLEATDGGVVDAPMLRFIGAAELVVDNAQQSLPALTDIRSSQINIRNRAGLITPNLQTIEDSSIAVSGTETFYRLPANITSYSSGATPINRFFEAKDGGALDLRSLVEIVPNSLGYFFSISASNGGTVALPNLTSLSGSSAHLQSVGDGSLVDLSSVAVWDGLSAISGARSSLRIEAGGAVVAPLLKRLANTDVTLSAPGHAPTAQLEQFSEGFLSVTDHAADLVSLTSFENAWLKLYEGGSTLTPKLDSIDGSSFTVEGTGTRFKLPNAITKYGTDPNGLWRYLQATDGGVLDLSALTEITAGSRSLELTAESGGTILLPNVSALTDGLTFVRADGAGSQIDLSALSSWRGSQPGLNHQSFLHVLDGASVNAPLLREVERVDVQISATALLPTSQIELFRIGHFQVTGQAIDLNKLTTFQEATLELLAGGSVATPALSDIAGSSFLVRGAGTQFTLPTTITKYGPDPTDLRRYLQATDGGVLDLSALTEFTAGSRSLELTAESGGTILLPNVPALTDGLTFVRADGAGSQIDLSALNGWRGSQPGLGNQSFLHVLDGATIKAPLLREMERVDVQISASALLPTSQIELFRIGHFQVTGQALDLSGLTTFQEATLELLAGGSVATPALSDIAGSSFLVRGAGTQFTLPTTITKYGPGPIDLWRYLQATDGGVLDLSALTEITAGSRSLEITAESGGTILLPNVPALTDGLTFVRADGAGSQIDLSALNGWRGSQPGLGNQSFLHVLDGATIKAPLLREVERVDVQISATALLPTSQIEQFSIGHFQVTGQAIDLNGLTTFQDATLELLSGGSVATPALNDIAGSSFLVRSTGSRFTLPSSITTYGPGPVDLWRYLEATDGGVLDLSALTEVVSGSRSLEITAESGGSIRLPNVSSLTDGLTFVRADGAGSQINFAALAAWRGSQPGLGPQSFLHVLDGASVNAPLLRELERVDASVAGSASEYLERIETWSNSSLLFDGGSHTLAALVEALDTSLMIDGASVNAPLLTTLGSGTVTLLNGGLLIAPNLPGFSGSGEGVGGEDGSLGGTSNTGTNSSLPHGNGPGSEGEDPPPPVARPLLLAYDAFFSQLAEETDELGRRVLHTIDPANGNRLQTRAIVGQDDRTSGETDDQVTSYTYTERGLLDTLADPLGRVTDWDYDSFGRVVRVTVAKGTADEAVMLTEYDAFGNVAAEVDANGNRTEYEYDVRDRPTLIRDALGNTTRMTYDRAGNLASMTNASGATWEYRYDARNRLIEMIDPLGNSTRYGYDRGGNLVSETDPLGHTTRHDYDVRGRRIRSIDPDGGVTRFAYDLDDNLISLTDPVGNTTRFEYDARSRQTAEIDPLGKSIRYHYDAADNLIRKADRLDRITEYHYDELYRLVSETWVGGDYQLFYNYDLANNLLNVRDAFSELTYTYDSRDRVNSVDNAGTPGAPNVVLEYSYDAVSNVLSVTDTIAGTPNGLTSFQYDSLDRLQSLTQSATPGALATDIAFLPSDKRVDFSYNALGQYRSVRRYSDLAGQNLVIDTAYAYDAIHRPLSIDHLNASGSPVSFFRYQFDAAHRITQITDIDGMIDYSYDDRDQLLGADYSDPSRTDELFAYDANGNRTSDSSVDSTYRNGPGNRLLSDGQYSYQYDNEGNLILRTELASGSTRELTWDYRNRLVEVVDKDSDGELIQRVRFTYDAFDRRIAKQVEQIDGASAESHTTHFVYDREDVAFDFENDTTAGSIELAKRYLHGPDIDWVLAQESSNQPGASWFTHDHLNSVRAAVDATGAVVSQFNFDAYGQRSQTGELDVRFGFTGREHDEELELLYNRARYYSPEAGRFISEDTILHDGRNSNLFHYVGNSPSNFIDPGGRLAFVPVIVAVARGGFVVWQIYETYQDVRTLLDECSTGTDKLLAATSFLPGGDIVKYGKKAGDAKILSRAAPKGLTQAGKKGLAKELGGIPRSAQPTAQGRYGQGTKWWEYTDSHGNRKIVVEHADGSVHVGRPKLQSQHLDGSGPPKYYPEPGTGHVGE